MTKREIIQSIDLLNAARDAYYNSGESILTDKEYDDELAKLAQAQEELNYYPSHSPVGKVGAPIRENGFKEVKHEFRARSLDKTKDYKQIAVKLHNDQRCEAVVMWKLDGCTLVLTYVDGDLVLAATRGDGEIGQDITCNAKYIDGIPQHIDMNPGKIIIRGECLISYDDFKRINDSLPVGTKPYSNPRNLASASVAATEVDDIKERHLTFKAFDFKVVEGQSKVINPNELVSQFLYLTMNGFNVVQHTLCEVTEEGIRKIIDKFTNAVEGYSYLVDGLVFALNDRSLSENLPGTEHHPDPKYGYAFKWADKTVETTLKEIEWSPSRTGLLNPVAIFEPKDIDGVTVSRASLHNLSYIKQKWLVVGDKISVYRANMVIPQVLDNLSVDMLNPEEEDKVARIAAINNCIPDRCPTCKGEARVVKSWDGYRFVETVICTNPNCPEKLIGNLVHFCSREGLDIEGWSEETIKKLHAVHIINEFKDIFLLKDNPAMSFMPGFGKKSWMNLCDSAEKARRTTFIKFVSALSIPNVGKGQAKILKKFIDENYEELSDRYQISDYDPFRVLVEMGLHLFDFTQIKGVGPKLMDDLITFMHHNFGAKESPYKRLMKYMTFIDLAPISKDFMNLPINSNIAGKSFCITGKLIHHANREELVDKIEASGGKWVDSVSSKTDYLINNDVTSTSGKNKKAQELGIPIISEESFLNMIR